MFLKNSIKIYILIHLLCLFLGCNKAEVIDSSLYAGNFYCHAGENITLQGGNTVKNYDQVIKICVENDTIKFLDLEFPISYPNQTEFKEENSDHPAVTEIYTRTLRYVDNFQRFYYSYNHRNTYYYLDKTSIGIFGTRSSIDEATSQAKEDLHGNYLLNFHEKNTSTNLDTHYVELSHLTCDDEYIYANSDFLTSNRFHSYYSSEYTGFNPYNGSYHESSFSTSWTVDSFGRESNSYITSNNVIDTTIKIITGLRN